MKNLFLILGSNGFLGNALVNKFIMKDSFVVGIGRTKYPKQKDSPSIKKSNFYYFPLMDKGLKSIKSELKIFCKNKSKNIIFVNSAWEGCNSISDGSFSKQIQNIYLSNSAIELAEEIGCSKFINIGSIFENYIDDYMQGNWANSRFSFEKQINYSLAKNICRDFNKLTSYLNKINYIHCTFSVFIDFQLSGKGYIPQTLKKIANGNDYIKPNNQELFDITFLDEGCEAIYLLSQKGKTNKNYYIGTSYPQKLKKIFNTFEEIKYNKNKYHLYESISNNLFDTKNIENDIGYKPSKIFNKFASEFFNR